MLKFRLNFLILAGLLLITGSLAAQQSTKKHNARYYRKNPVWIDMMNDPQANYFETIKAFREYWKDKALPKEEFEKNGADNFEKEVGLVQNEKEEAEREKRVKVKKGISYAAEVRAFKGWLQTNKEWVREDGSIISEQERQQMINKQQAELKAIENKNGKK